jgi:AcrR family transcriptional regulator
MDFFAYLENNDRNKILVFCHNKFVNEGFTKTSMDELAQELGVSKKTIYKYFDSKDTLISEVCDLRIETMKKYIDEIINSDDDCIVKFEKIGDLHANFTKNCSQAYMKDVKVHAPHLNKKFEDFGRETSFRVFSKLLNQGKKEKLISEDYPNNMVIEIFSTSMQRVCTPDFLLNNGYTMKEAFEYVVDIIFTGFLTTEGKKRFKNRSKKVSQNN